MSLFSKKPKTSDSTVHNANFYFYFAKESKGTAEVAEKEFSKEGFKTDLHLLDIEGGVWSLTLNKQVTGLDEVYKLEKAFESAAEKYNCDYDGHEIEV